MQQDAAVPQAGGIEPKAVLDIQQQAAAALHVATVDITKPSSDMQYVSQV
jgi:hypothetical protein